MFECSAVRFFFAVGFQLALAHAQRYNGDDSKKGSDSMAPGAWRQRQRCWQVALPFEGAADLARQLGTSPLVAQVLHNRGASTLEAARGFLQPRMDALHDPRLMPNIEAAAARLAQAVARKEHITLYGDYDVDGITGLAILRGVLAAAGAS